MAETPVASVVVATHNRVGLLPRLLDALEAQEGVGGFEVVVVDDASTDGTAERLADLAARSSLTVRVHRLERNAGPAAARNIGWKAAQARTILFTDDDCIPQPTWISTLLSRLEDADLVGGVTLRHPDQIPTNWGPFSVTMEMTTDEGFYPTCNMAYRREVLESVAGFDERFRYPFGEDTDLAWRAIGAGARPAFEPDAVVYHDIRPSNFVDYVRNMRRREGLVQLLSRHPGLRGRLGKGTFLWPTHPWALAAAGAGVALLADPGQPARWVAAAAAGAGYAKTARWYHPKPKRRLYWAGVFPLAFIADLYEIGVLTRASVRYRTVLL